MICHARNPYRRPSPSSEGERLRGRAVAVAAALLTALTALASPAAAAEDAAPRPSNAQIIKAAARSPWPAFSACVSWRESHGNYRARNPEAGSTAMGRWQFINGEWNDESHSLPHMVRERLIEFGMDKATARKWRLRLSDLPIARWPGVMQVIGHAAVLVAGMRGEGNGWLHWQLDGSRCNQLRGE